MSTSNSSPRPATRNGTGSIPELLNLSGVYDPTGGFKPDRSNQLLVGRPAVRDVYWCTFTDTIAPEMGKKRPVVIVSLNNKIGQTSTVVPLTSKPDETPSEHRVPVKNPNPSGGPEVWAIPSQVTTVSHWRLSRYWVSRSNCRVTPRICEADFDAIVAELWRNLPMPR